MRLRRLNKLVRCVGLFLIVALVGTQAPPVFAQLPQGGHLVSGLATWEADLDEGWMVVDQESQARRHRLGDLLDRCGEQRHL